MDETRRRANRTDSGWSSNSSKSSNSMGSVFKTRSVPSWEKQAIEEQRAAEPGMYQWTCPTYNLTWDDLVQHLRRKFPDETFSENQRGDCWVFNAPAKQTQKDRDEFAGLRPRPQPQPHQYPQQYAQQHHQQYSHHQQQHSQSRRRAPSPE